MEAGAIKAEAITTDRQGSRSRRWGQSRHRPTSPAQRLLAGLQRRNSGSAHRAALIIGDPETQLVSKAYRNSFCILRFIGIIPCYINIYPKRIPRTLHVDLP